MTTYNLRRFARADGLKAIAREHLLVYLTSSLRSLSFKDTRLPNLLRRILFSWRR